MCQYFSSACMDGNRDSRGHARYPAVGASALAYCQDGKHDVIHWADYRRVEQIQGFVEVVHLGQDAANNNLHSGERKVSSEAE